MQTPNVMNFLTVRSSEERNAQEEEQAAKLAELLVEFAAVTRTAEFNHDSVRLLVIALFLEHWELVGPAPEENRYLRAFYAFDTLKMTLDISFAQAKLLRLPEIRSRILLELKLIESHFLGYDKAKVASIGKENGAKTAIAVVQRLFQDGAVKFSENLRRLAAELEVALSDPEQGRSEAGDPAKERTDVPIVRDAATEARDKWLYEQCKKLVTYSTIIKKLATKPAAWLRIDTANGIKHAAAGYAERHKLQPIPKRQRGRIASK